MEMSSKNLKIMAWNSRSVKHKTADLKLFLDTENPTIIGICETWLKPKDKLIIKDYDTIRKDRPINRGGGLAFLIKKHVSYKREKLTPYPRGSLEQMCLSVHLSGEWCTILLIYNPCANIKSDEFNHYLDQISGSALVIGDINAHHPLWGCTPEVNPTGCALHEALTDHNTLKLLTEPGTITRLDPVTGKGSTLDLILEDKGIGP